MKLYPLLIILPLVLPLPMRASDNTKQDGEKLIEQAETKANIFALPSFEMKAKVRVDSKGKPLEGSYLFFWNGPEQWREEISIPGYSEIQVGGKGVVFLKRSTDFLPLRIYQLHSSLGYGSRGYGSGVPQGNFIHAMLQPDETIKKIHDRKENGTKLRCAEVVGKYNYTREVCVDSSTGTRVRRAPFLDREAMPIGTKSFYHFLSYVEKGKPVVEVQITELKATESFPSSLFEPSPGAISRPGCMNPTPFHLLNRVPPHYPDQERQSHVEGTVAVSASIGNDGMPRGLRVVLGATPGLNNATLDAVQQWRWEPATCNGVAVNVETVITINYELQ